jgi:hypothetical protein
MVDGVCDRGDAASQTEAVSIAPAGIPLASPAGIPLATHSGSFFRLPD